MVRSRAFSSNQISEIGRRQMKRESPCSIAIFADGPGDTLRVRAAELAAHLSLPLVDGPEKNCELLLVLTEERLELRLNEKGAPGPVYVDFRKGSLGFQQHINPFGKLIRAVCRGGGEPDVVDATAGLGHDAFLLAHRGCRVTAVERSPVVAALLRDGIERAAVDPELHRMLTERIRLVCADARDYLDGLPSEEAPEVVLIDPMFPPRKKTALVKKEMRVVRRLVGDDEDSAELVAAARRVATRSVVVKRMLRAPPLAPGPLWTCRGKTTRYDVYSC
jgi:16S rRNA (guanine1516-N2)-methyltransferase